MYNLKNFFLKEKSVRVIEVMYRSFQIKEV